LTNRVVLDQFVEERRIRLVEQDRQARRRIEDHPRGSPSLS
jgi:hypothetical protein